MSGLSTGRDLKLLNPLDISQPFIQNTVSFTENDINNLRLESLHVGGASYHLDVDSWYVVHRVYVAS